MNTDNVQIGDNDNLDRYEKKFDTILSHPFYLYSAYNKIINYQSEFYEITTELHHVFFDFLFDMENCFLNFYDNSLSKTKFPPLENEPQHDTEDEIEFHTRKSKECFLQIEEICKKHNIQGDKGNRFTPEKIGHMDPKERSILTETLNKLTYHSSEIDIISNLSHVKDQFQFQSFFMHLFSVFDKYIFNLITPAYNANKNTKIQYDKKFDEIKRKREKQGNTWKYITKNLTSNYEALTPEQKKEFRLSKNSEIWRSLNLKRAIKYFYNFEIDNQNSNKNSSKYPYFNMDYNFILDEARIRRNNFVHKNNSADYEYINLFRKYCNDNNIDYENKKTEFFKREYFSNNTFMSTEQSIREKEAYDNFDKFREIASKYDSEKDESLTGLGEIYGANLIINDKYFFDVFNSMIFYFTKLISKIYPKHKILFYSSTLITLSNINNKVYKQSNEINKYNTELMKVGMSSSGNSEIIDRLMGFFNTNENDHQSRMKIQNQLLDISGMINFSHKPIDELSETTTINIFLNLYIFENTILTHKFIETILLNQNMFSKKNKWSTEQNNIHKELIIIINEIPAPIKLLFLIAVEKYTSLEKKGYLTQDNFKNEEIKIIEYIKNIIKTDLKKSDYSDFDQLLIHLYKNKLDQAYKILSKQIGSFPFSFITNTIFFEKMMKVGKYKSYFKEIIPNFDSKSF